MKKVELVFIPWPGIGHLSSTIQIAHLLLHRNHSLSITVLTVPLPWEAKTTAQLESPSASSITGRIRFLTLPEQPLGDDAKSTFLYKAVLESQKQHLKEAVAKLSESADSPTLAGFVIDMFCVTMIDVANELGVPSYVYFTSNAGFLSLALHLQELYDQHDKESEQFMRSDVKMIVPGFSNPVPGTVIPSVYSNKITAEWLHENARRYRETSGILVNTFSELESHVLDSFSELPPVYAVGPILSLNKKSSAASSESENGAEILKWLDEQPPTSVVFLCFGSRGGFNPDQAKEIAQALERSGYRFVWSLRQPQEGIYGMPIEYANMEDVLPEGFLDRTAEIGRVIGWAPQVEILGHPATGGFVSHCGWNSTLESLWYGVPMGTWPMYAEQHFNAFEMEVELALAVGISLDFGQEVEEEEVIVSAEKIESGIRKLMAGESEVRNSVKTKSEEGRRSMEEGGSSFTSLNRFIHHVTKSGD